MDQTKSSLLSSKASIIVFVGSGLIWFAHFLTSYLWTEFSCGSTQSSGPSNLTFELSILSAFALATLAVMFLLMLLRFRKMSPAERSQNHVTKMALAASAFFFFLIIVESVTFLVLGGTC